MPGDGSTRRAFVALDDVTSILAAAAAAPEGGTNLVANLGGPEVLSWNKSSRSMRAPGTHAPETPHAGECVPPAGQRARALLPAGRRSRGDELAHHDLRDGLGRKAAAERFGIRLMSAEQFLKQRRLGGRDLTIRAEVGATNARFFSPLLSRCSFAQPGFVG